MALHGSTHHSAPHNVPHYSLQPNGPTNHSATSVKSGALAEAHLLHGPSLAMSTLWARLQRVAPYFRTVLLTGESGAGHEAVARALHQLSPFNARGFAAVRAAEADALLVQEAGLKSAAALGMIYLPDPDRLSPAAQAGLLRLMRERGAAAPRLVTFAERGLRSLISARSFLPSAAGFSPELANSLGALQIEVPALRERVEDIPLLAGHLLRAEAETLGVTVPGLADDFLEALSRRPWPGNLDQMRAALRWILEHPHSHMLHAEDLHTALAAMEQAPSAPVPQARLVSLDQIVREQVHAVLMACNGNKLRAAEILGISRSTLYRMLGATGSAWPPAGRLETGE